MSAATRSSKDWLQLASLGEQLRSEDSLSAQRDRIAAMANRLIEGKVDVWLHENIFRLPDWDDGSIFPTQPVLDGMKRAIKTGKLARKKKSNGKKTPASRSTFAAIPLEDQGITLGALQVSRSKGPEFSDDELNLLQGLGHIISVNLFASHRAEVEQFRLRQLNLVREVSAQTANSYLDDLSGPVQIHHGTDDAEVPIEFSVKLFDQIKAAGEVGEIYTYLGDDHNLSQSLSTALQRSVAFFDKYVKNG